MIVDVTGLVLIPGNGGADCPGNGLHGDTFECCCDECDYMLCCTEPAGEEYCLTCKETDCPRHPAGQQSWTDDFPFCEVGKL